MFGLVWLILLSPGGGGVFSSSYSDSTPSLLTATTAPETAFRTLYFYSMFATYVKTEINVWCFLPNAHCGWFAFTYRFCHQNGTDVRRRTVLARLFHERMFARRLILWSHVANASSNICNPVSTKNTNLKPLAAETVVAAQDGAPIGTIASITGEICALAWLHEDEMMCNFQLNCLNWLQPPSRCRVICCYLSWETESPQKLEVYFLQH